MADLKKLAEEIVGLTLLEAQELKTILKDEYGIEPAAAAVAVAGPAAAGAGEAAAEKSSFDVNLKDAGASKLQVIKAVKAITNAGLADAKAMVDGAPKAILEKAKKEDAEKAKELVDGAPSVVQKDMDKASAEALKKTLEEAGATVELQ